MLYSIEVGDKTQLDKILRINRKIFHDLNVPDVFDKKAYQEILDTKKYLILNIVERGIIVGNTIAIERNKNYHIWVMAITDDLIKQGIGKKLIDSHIKLAKEGKYKAVTITIYDTQTELINVIKDEGFQIYRRNLQEERKDYRLKLN